MHWLVQDAGGSALTDEIRGQFAAEFHGTKKKRKKRAA